MTLCVTHGCHHRREGGLTERMSYQVGVLTLSLSCLAHLYTWKVVPFKLHLSSSLDGFYLSSAPKQHDLDISEENETCHILGTYWKLSSVTLPMGRPISKALVLQLQKYQKHHIVTSLSLPISLLFCLICNPFNISFLKICLIEIFEVNSISYTWLINEEQTKIKQNKIHFVMRQKEKIAARLFSKNIQRTAQFQCIINW